MCDGDRLSDAERRLNLALRPGQESIARVIAGALRPRSPRRQRHIAVVGASMLALAVAAGLLWRGTAPAASLVISGDGSIVVVASEDGRRWLIQAQQSSPSSGEYVIAFPQ